MENSLTSLTLLYLAVHLLKQRCIFFSGNSNSTFYGVTSVTLQEVCHAHGVFVFFFSCLLMKTAEREANTLHFIL